MRNSKNTDIRQVLPVVQAPALVLHRTGDQVEAIEAGRYVASRIGGARFVELDGDDGIPWLGDVDALTSEVESFLAGKAGADKGSDRRLATVLFTDIVGSTEHLAALGDAKWRQRLREHASSRREPIISTAQGPSPAPTKMCSLPAGQWRKSH